MMAIQKRKCRFYGVLDKNSELQRTSKNNKYEILITLDLMFNESVVIFLGFLNFYLILFFLCRAGVSVVFLRESVKDEGEKLEWMLWVGRTCIDNKTGKMADKISKNPKFKRGSKKKKQQKGRHRE